MTRVLVVFFAVLGLGRPAAGQIVRLAETPTKGTGFTTELSLVVAGKLKVELPGGKSGSETLEATAAHAYVEWIEFAEGGRTHAIRSYGKATSTSLVAGGKHVRELPSNRRIVAVRHGPDGVVPFHPEHPLTRDELELVREQFDTLVLPRLLPAADVAVGGTWTVSDEAVKAVCLFDSVSSQSLTGKLVEATPAVAIFTIEGAAAGTESGAAVKLTVKARGRFDRATNRVVALTWEQEDDRAQGPASPAAELKATVTLKRQPLSPAPPELTAAVRAAVPFGNTPDRLLNVRHTDASGRYTLVYPRGWHVTGETNEHLVLRLIEDGDWTAQATILSFKPKADGPHMSAAEFKEAVAKQPGWEPAAVAAAGEIPAGPGRWLYRISAAGKQDGLAVVQSFFCLADANGNQAVVTVIAREDRAAKLGTRDVALVNAIEFPGKK